MAKGSRGRRRIASRLYMPTPYPLPSYDRDVLGGTFPKKCSRVLENKDWEDATCSVCMEYPHNAVLLLCSSYEIGCRPYMCGTSFRFSNCLDQYKIAYTKVTSSHDNQQLASDDSDGGGPVPNWPIEKCEVVELACPLCRGQVKGWTVVEPARDYLNAKKRSCMQDSCSFVGNYKELRKHVRAEHPSARPREVDPTLQRKWRRLEREREREDVISTIASSMPGTMVFGDYVVDGPNLGLDSDEEGLFDADAEDGNNGGFEVGLSDQLFNVVLLLHGFGVVESGGTNRGQRPERSYRILDEGSVGIHHLTPVVRLDSSDEDNGNERNEDDAGDDSSLEPLVNNGRGRLHLDRVRRRDGLREGSRDRG